MHRLGLGALALLALTLGPALGAGAQDEPRADDVEATAHALEQRLRAPCCWNQTLDVHSSEVSQELRGEIRTRLRRGETPEEIEADMVSRYGERILAVPPDNPLGTFALVALLLAFGAGAAVVFMGMRWRKRGGGGDGPSKGGDGGKGSGSDKKEKDQDEWDARLDAELKDA
jgi:cytochrome c-type biogenesis protein CcmH